ncbi:hypothetical protein ACOCJ4_06030 [Knoellia sp. CPCC 206435]|uniref:hypothetical protein n=1 Tax=Knoellia terrae TaxID=3404797 RepID=UPI003B439196
MTFHDLPPHSRDLPLDDPTLRADLVDLVVSLAAREGGCLALLLLDDDHVCTTPMLVEEMGVPQPEQVQQVLGTVLGQLEIPGLVAAVGRPGSGLFTDADRACHQAVVEACRARGITLLGTYLASDNAVREMPDHLRLAS